MTLEEQARKQVDAQLIAPGWFIQTKDKIDLSASRGVAICEIFFAIGDLITRSLWMAKHSHARGV